MTLSTSDEVDERRLELAARAGDAYQAALSYMVEEVAETGASQEIGDYRVAFAQEEAEGMYVRDANGDLEWREPDDDTVVEFDPGFLWHPGLFHYTANVALPGDGTYTIRVDVEPPGFARRDRTNGDRYADDVQVTFEDVGLETGQS
jgi:hypothetical protein